MNLLPKKNPTTVNIGENVAYIEKELTSDNDVIRRSDAIDEVNNLTYPSSLADVKRKLMAIPAVEPKHGENTGTDYAECDQFICSECGIHLQGWVRIDEDDYDDGIVHEYEFRFCPNCGAKIKGVDGE